MIYAWSPDGNDIVFVTGDNNQIQNDLVLVSSSGGKARVLVDHGRHLFLTSPAYTRDGHSVFVNVTGLNQPGVWSLRLDSLRLVFATPALLAVPSPDGEALAVAVGPAQGLRAPDWAIRIIDAKDGSIAESIPLSGSAPIRVDEITWAPDGSKLAFSETPEGLSGSIQTAFLRVIALQGAIPSQWPHDLANYVDPAWSPDGRYLAMVALRAGASSGQLVIWDMTTGCKEQLTGVDSLNSPKWSPDGEKLAFVYYYSIYVLDVKAARNAGRLQTICSSTGS